MGAISDVERRARSGSHSRTEAHVIVPGATKAAEAVLWLLLIATPLALGAVSATATALMEAGCFAAFLLASYGKFRGNPHPVPRVFGVVVGLFVLWTLGQLIPLPPSLLRVVSPGTHRLYQANLPGYDSKEAVDLESWLQAQREGTSKDLEPRPDLETGFEGRIPIRGIWKSVSWYPDQTLLLLSRFLAYWAVWLLVFRFLPGPACGKRLPWLILVSGAAICFVGILQRLTWNGKIFWLITVYQGSPFGPWVNRNHFSGYMELTLFLGLAVLAQSAGWGTRGRRRRRSRRTRIPIMLLVSSMLICILAALVMAGSRGGLFSLALVLTAYLLLQVGVARKKLHRPVLAFVIAALPLLLLVGGIAWYVIHGGALEAEEEVDVEPSLASRLQVWKGMLGMISENPLAGTGLGTFGQAYPIFKTEGQISIWEEAHNDYLEVLAESGVLGFGLFLVGSLVFVGRFLLPTLRQPWRLPAPVELGAALGVTTLLIHSVVDFNLQIPSNGLLFVLAGAILVRGRVESRSRKKGDRLDLGSGVQKRESP